MLSKLVIKSSCRHVACDWRHSIALQTCNGTMLATLDIISPLLHLRQLSRFFLDSAIIALQCGSSPSRPSFDPLWLASSQVRRSRDKCYFPAKGHQIHPDFLVLPCRENLCRGHSELDCLVCIPSLVHSDSAATKYRIHVHTQPVFSI